MTVVPMKHRFGATERVRVDAATGRLSTGARSSVSVFSTGIASPVSADWLMKRSFAREQPHVGRNHVAGGQVHDVAGHEVLEGHLASLRRRRGRRSLMRELRPPRDGGGRAHQRAKRLGRMRRAELLGEPHQHADRRP